MTKHIDSILFHIGKMEEDEMGIGRGGEREERGSERRPERGSEGRRNRVRGEGGREQKTETGREV